MNHPINSYYHYVQYKLRKVCLVEVRQFFQYHLDSRWRCQDSQPVTVKSTFILIASCSLRWVHAQQGTFIYFLFSYPDCFWTSLLAVTSCNLHISANQIFKIDYAMICTHGFYHSSLSTPVILCLVIALLWSCLFLIRLILTIEAIILNSVNLFPPIANSVD